MAYSVNLDPTTNETVKIKLFRNVSNLSELRQKLISGTLKCAIIKPSLIVDPFQIVVAANKAATSEKLKTRTVYTEILFNLSVSKNITQSLQTFGANDADTDILVVVIEKNDNKNSEDIFENVKGEETNLDILKDIVDVDYVRKVYKMNEVEAKNIEILDSVVSRIAAKDCVL